MKSRRISRKDWLAVGLDGLRDPDADFATMEQVCSRAGKTRGGFYAHFPGIEEFWLEVARTWLHTFTESLFTVAGKPHPGLRTDRLNDIAARLDPLIELGIRRLAVVRSPVADIVAEADARRVAHLSDLYLAAGVSSAAALARIEYAAYVGLMHTEPEMNPPELRALYSDFLRLTGRG